MRVLYFQHSALNKLEQISIRNFSFCKITVIIMHAFKINLIIFSYYSGVHEFIKNLCYIKMLSRTIKSVHRATMMINTMTRYK